MIVQATSIAHVSDRLARVCSRWETAVLLRAGVLVQIWGWGHSDRPKRVAVQGEDLVPTLMEKPRRRKPDRQRSLFDGLPW